MLVATTLTHHFQVTTQMVFAGTLLRLPAGEIEDVIRHELADNLALESEALSAPHHRELRQLEPLSGVGGRPTTRQGERSYWDADAQGNFLANLAAPQPPLEQLLEQARFQITCPDLEVVTALIYRLDKHGYLPRFGR